MLLIAALALGDAPPAWVEGFGAGAAAAVVAVVVQAGIKLIDPRRGLPYVVAGALGAVFAGPYVVAVLLLCGLAQLARHVLLSAVWPALVWLAFKVGALSYGGGYVIIPLMYGDAVEAQRWMTEQEFANAVAYGQITPGPVTHTVALVGYAASGLRGGARGHGDRLRPELRAGHARRAVLRAPAREPPARGTSWTAPARPRRARSSAPPSRCWTRSTPPGSGSSSRPRARR